MDGWLARFPDRLLGDDGEPLHHDGGLPAPGKRTLTQRISARPEGHDASDGVGYLIRSVQMEAARPAAADDDPFAIHITAREGVRDGGGALPHLAAIQASFGHHDVGGVRAHVGGAAAEASAAIGASAYATGDDVAFASTPDLRQAAHEAAHVVQQRGGVRLDGGVGRVGDPYEHHADAVADLVVRGDSAEALLDTMAHRGAAGGAAVQREDFDGDGRDDGTLSATLRRAVAAVTTVAALSEAQIAAMALMGTAPERTVAIGIGGAEYPILGREVRALLVYLDARMVALGALEGDLARGGGETGVADSGLGRRSGPTGTTTPERHVSADVEGGFRFDVPMPGPYGGELHVAVSISGLADVVAAVVSPSPSSSPSSSDDGGGASVSFGGPVSSEGVDRGVGVTGALQELFAPGCDILRDRFGVTREPDGSTHVMFGLDFWPFPPIDEHAEVRFQVDIVEMEWGERGLRVHGPQAGVHAQGTMGYLHDHLPEGMRSRITVPPAMRPVTIGVDFMWEPNWAAVAAQLGLAVAEDAAVAGAAGATAAELTLGGAEAAAIAGELAVDAALLVIAAPEILLIGGVVLVVAAGYALSSGRDAEAYPEPLSTDHQPGVDDPLTHLGHDFGRAINQFGAGYANALLGLTAPDGEAAQHGHVAGRRRREELVAAGHAATDIAFAARAAADLQPRLRDANRAALEQEARELAAQHATARATQLHRSESTVRAWAERHLLSIAHSGSDGLIAPTIGHARSVMRMTERAVDPAAVQAHAGHGIDGGGESLPHLATIQASFGHHEVSEVRAHVGGHAAEASAAMGARAYASGNDVAFASSPDLRLAAHEAAHVVQQRGDVRLDGGVGRAGDPYEQHADAVADLVMRGDSAEALLDTMAHRGAAGGSAVQRRDFDDPVYIDIVVIPREMPTQAGRQLQAALLRGIPADRRRDQGLVLLNTLPALANILDPSITAAGEGELIVSRSSAWHPASYEGDGIPAQYMWALWDYFKARWESDDRPTRRAHLEAAHDHWYDLMTVRLFNEYVRTERDEVRALVHSLIDGPARRLRSDATFDVLSHDGNALSVEERAARARRATEAAAARPSHRGSTTRSETIDVAPEAVRVADGEPRTVRYISPAALAFVPHIPSETPNPRRAAFDPLAAVLNDLIAAEGDVAATAAVEARLATTASETRDRMRVYVRQHRRGAERDTALVTIDSLELTTDVVVRSHDVDVGMFRVHLEPVAPGALIERPGGFRASVTDIATGRGATGGASEEVMTAVLSGFSGDEQVMARQYLDVIRRAEGSLTSLNTWDRLRITLGAGVGAAGRLQDRFAMFEGADAEAYERIFGRHGIGVEGRGIHGERGSGRSVFETTGDDGEALSGTEATEEMANDPAALGVMVTAGFDPAWQTFLLQGGAGSLRRAFTVGFTVAADGAVTLAEGGGTRVYDWLHGHVSANVLAAAMFAFADDFHGSGSLTSGTTSGFGPQYLAAATTSHFEPAHPETAPDAARATVGAWIVTDCSHARRRRFIAEALGAGSYGAITGG